MSLFGVPNDFKDAVFAHPGDKLLHREHLHDTVGHLGVANDGVQLLDAKNSTLE